MEKLKIRRNVWLAIIFNILFVVFLFEIGLRVLAPTATLTSFARPCIVQEDPKFGYLFLPNSTSYFQQYNEIDNWIEMNSWGFHDVERELDSGQNKILVLGDSFTSANQIPVDAGWTQLIERSLEDTAVFNLGVDGYGTDRQLNVLKHYAPLIEPEIVILAFFENDVKDTLAQVILDCYDDHLIIYQTDVQKQQMISFLDENKPTDLAYTLAKYSAFYRATASLFSKSGFLLSTNRVSPIALNMQLEPLPEEPPELMLGLFAEYEALAEQYDFQMMVVPIPSKENPDLSLTLLEGYFENADWSRVQIMDVYPEMEARYTEEGLEHADLYYVYDGHFNEYGYELFGQQVAHALQTRILNKEE